MTQSKDIRVSTQQLLQRASSHDSSAGHQRAGAGGGGWGFESFLRLDPLRGKKCAYSEMPVTERDELSDAVARSIHHWVHTAALRTKQESTDEKKEEKKNPQCSDDQPALMGLCGGSAELRRWEGRKQAGRQAVRPSGG